MGNMEIHDQPKATFEQVLEANKDKIYRICRIYAVVPLEPQDLFQEVVYQIWKSYTTFKGNSAIDTWVYKIALNVCQRLKMKSDNRNEQIVRLDAIQFVPADLTPDKSMQEQYKALHDCIATLNEGDQSLMVLLLEGLPYREIATITGLTENHVAVKLKRIRKLLFDCITPKLG